MAKRRRRKKKSTNIYQVVLGILIFLLVAYIGYYREDFFSVINTSYGNSSTSYSIDNVPLYTGEEYIIINDNIPNFQESDYSTTSYESYSDLDDLGRCGVAMANIGSDLMPTEDRGSIGMVQPSGWHTVKYDIVSGKYLYNRCHLIGYQLTGENANEKNLITCTRQMNVGVMLEF